MNALQLEDLKSKDSAISQLSDQIQNLKVTQGKQVRSVCYCVDVLMC